MKKSVAAALAVLMCLLCISFTGCNNNPDVGTPDDPAVTQNTQTFINIVSKIETPVTVDAGGKIASALLVYDALSDVEKTNENVIAQKTVLDGYKSEYDVAKAAADAQAAAARDQKAIAYFVKTVNALPDIGGYILDHRADIDAAYEIYNALKDELKTDVSVVAAKAKLDAADAEVKALEQREHERQVKEEAEQFIADVAELKEALEEAEGEFSEAIETLVNSLLDRYDLFEDDVKAYEDEENELSVAAAKDELDVVAEGCKTWRDEKDVDNFIKQAEALGDITLESDGAISAAESLYKYMSDEAKEMEGVAEAWATVQAARETYKQLYAADQAIKVEAFIAAANAVREDIENLDILWYDALHNAYVAYYALGYESQQLPEVKEAFERWDRAQAVFDSKKYKHMPFVEPNLLFSGHTENAILVVQNFNNMSQKLTEFYEVNSMAALDGKLIIWLNVYVDGQYVARAALNPSVVVFETPAIVIQNALKSLADDHSEIVNGGTFAFTFSFADKNDTYIPSAETNKSPTKKYTW